MTLGMLLLAISMGLDVFAGGLSLGVGGLERTGWARTALIFGAIAFLMTSLGVLFGRLLGDRLGDHASYIAGAVLLIVGFRALADGLLGERDEEVIARSFDVTAIVLVGVVVCIDKLAVGLTIAFIDASATPLIAWIVVISFVATMLGLSLGQRLGAHAEHLAEIAAGALFVFLGLLIIYQTAVGESYL